MPPPIPVGRYVIYALLGLGTILFGFPFVWLIATSLKPIEQTMSQPLTWLPRAFYAEIGGERLEVSRDFRIGVPSVLAEVTAGPAAGQRVLVRTEDFSAAAAGGDLRHLRDVAPGEWRVTERIETKARDRAARWTVVTEEQLETRIVPRWGNYPKALATIGGRSLEEIEGTVETVSEARAADVTFARFLTNTIIVCVLGVIGAVLSNAIIAYGFARIQWRGRDTFFALTLATMMIPFPVLMVPLYGVFKGLGWIGTLLPLWVPAFFGSAFNIFLMRQFFRTIPAELSEAARIDGCSEWGVFWRVVLPLSRPVLAVVALFHFLHAWNDFLGPLLFLTRKETFTLALALQNYQSQHGGVQWHYLMAASAVTILPIVVLFFFTQKTFIQGIATTGSKS
jgi:multiple sugar transport system permease protein